MVVANRSPLTPNRMQVVRERPPVGTAARQPIRERLLLEHDPASVQPDVRHAVPANKFPKRRAILIAEKSHHDRTLQQAPAVGQRCRWLGREVIHRGSTLLSPPSDGPAAVPSDSENDVGRLAC